MLGDNIDHFRSVAYSWAMLQGEAGAKDGEELLCELSDDLKARRIDPAAGARADDPEGAGEAPDVSASRDRA